MNAPTIATGTCVFCGSPFIPVVYGHEKKYCSRKCKDSAGRHKRRKRGQSCLVCESAVPPGRRLQFCSDRCKLEHSTVRHDPSDLDGCDLWVGRMDRGGYGKITVMTGIMPVHRFAYELEHGPLPLGAGRSQQVAHLCHDWATAGDGCPGGVGDPHRRCVRIDHLAVQTPRENTAATPHALATINAVKTHCVNGHPLSGDNLHIRPDGSRTCRICHGALHDGYRRLQKEAAAALGIGVTAYRRQYGYSTATARAVIAGTCTPTP